MRPMRQPGERVLIRTSLDRSFHMLLFLALFGLAVLPGALRGQMLDPALDRDDEPFSYFSNPTDVIGVMDGREATLVTPEGYLYTGFGELMFFTGYPPVPLTQRVKTLQEGHLPVILYTARHEDARYEACMFAATLDGRPESPLMNFVRFRVTNTGERRRRVFFSAAVRYQNETNTDWGFGDHRFARPVQAEVPGGLEQAGVAFNPDWTYTFAGDAFLRDGKILYLFPDNPAPVKMMTLWNGGNEVPPTGPQQIPCLPSTPVGVVQYDPVLEPGADAEFVFKMPYAPIDSSDRTVGLLRGASYEAYRQRTVMFWEDLFSRGVEIDLPERKVVDAFKANLVFSLIARNRQDGYAIQKVNEFQYDAFWIRDAAYFVRMYDLSGYHDIARECLAFFPRWQRDDGNFVSHGGQYDGFGQALWAYGQHYRMTQDAAFAASAYPLMRRAFDWLRKARSGDPCGLVPATTPGDNENISGHVTGHNFWALAGLKNLIAVAEGLGKREEAKTFAAEYDDLRSTLLKRLRAMTPLTGGAMPPGLDSLGGQDWGNMLSVYPEQILDPFDPMVTATLLATQAKYQEGIMTYGDGRYLHHYLTMKNTETEVIRGDQEIALEELYALLVHTASTHTGFEFYILPWGTRDFGMNLAPHGWFSAKFRTLLRNMLVREQGDTLHLFSVLSPEWVGGGRTVALRRAPTEFGSVDAVLETRPEGAMLTLDHRWRRKPASVVVHVPWYMDVQRVDAVGGPAVVRPGRIECAPGVRKLTIVWDERPGAIRMSYDRAVREYKAEYRRRYDAWMSDRSFGNH